jgi:trafficking protein particle complex subunit 10
MQHTLMSILISRYYMKDNDSYRMSVKRQIKAWMDVITTKKNQEWMLVYVAGQDTRKGASYLGLKTSVYDKIKNDFNIGKRDRYAK